MADFPDGVAIVLGGSGGIGRAIVERLAHYGAHVALTYRGNRDGAEAAAADARAHGVTASIHPLALGDPAAVAALFAELRAARGPVHTVVHAAGSGIAQPLIRDVTPAQWREVIDADVNGFFDVVHASLPLVREARGSYVFISSAGLERYPAGDILSVAPKAAVEALITGLAREEGRHGVRANSVLLGVIDAGMFPRLVEAGHFSAAWVEAAQRNAALRRFGTAAEVAEAVAFLASRRASYLTGQRLLLDGGYSL
ncbi:MAG TPA: SDR family oxidoreductase [Kofleriaceae bacterium]|nr:SDR family oxidoreductase [Kofleriaceae bacterium]